MAWSPREFEAWFSEYATGPTAAGNVRRVARAHGLAAVSGDLHSIWYLRVVRTMHNKAGRGEDVGTVATEDEARAYVYRALVRCACDLLVRPVEEPVDPATMVAVDPEEVDSGSLEGTAAVLMALRVRLEAAPQGRYGCPGHRCIHIALAVVELGVGARGGSERPAPSGGTDEWDRLTYEAMDRLYPAVGPSEDPRRDQRARQMKSRCGRCARETLQELYRDQGLGPGRAQ